MSEIVQNGMPEKIEVDEGLHLRFLRPDDAPVIFQMILQSPDIRLNVGLFQDCATEQQVREKIADQMSHGALRYGIIKADELVGYVGTWPDPDVNDAAQYNISYFLDLDERGEGIVTRSLHKLLIEAEKYLEIDRFDAWAAEGNEASAAILLNLGFIAGNAPLHNTEGRVYWDYVKEVKR